MRETAFNGGKRFSAVKVPRQYPFVVLLKIVWGECNAFGRGTASYCIRSEF